MAINFPNAPSSGQVYEYGDYTYTFDGVKWTSILRYGLAAAKVSSETPPPNPEAGLMWYVPSTGESYLYYVDEDGGQWIEERPSIGAVAHNYLDGVNDAGAHEAGAIALASGKSVQYDSDDRAGFDAALYADAGIVDNGLPDTAVASQRLDAINHLIAHGGESVRVANYLPKGHDTTGTVSYRQQIQAAIDYAAANNRSLVWPDYYLAVDLDLSVPPPQYAHPNALIVRSNSNWINQAKIKLLPATGDGYNILYIKDVENVNLFRPLVIGDRDAHIGPSGEWGYGIAVMSGCKKINIFEPETHDCIGDGIYVGLVWGETRQDSAPSEIRIIRPIDRRSRRNGLSVTACDDCLVIDPYAEFNNGTAPMAAIDIEPENLDGAAIPHVINLRIHNGSCKSCDIGVSSAIFKREYICDVTFTGDYKTVDTMFPLMLLSPYGDTSVSSINFGSVSWNNGATRQIIISAMGSHNYHIDKLMPATNSLTFVLTPQLNQAGQCIVRGVSVNEVVDPEFGVLMNIGITTDAMQPQNLPILLDEFSIASTTRNFAFLFLDSTVSSNSLYTANARMNIESEFDGFEVNTKTLSNDIVAKGQAGYNDVTFYVDNDRRTLEIAASPTLSLSTNFKLILSSKNSAIFYTLIGGVPTTAATVSCYANQRFIVRWIEGTVASYAVTIIG